MLVEATHARRKNQLSENTSKVFLKTNENVRLFTFQWKVIKISLQMKYFQPSSNNVNYVIL